MARVDGLRRNLVQRNERKGAFSQPGMGKFQIRFTEAKVSHEKDIQIERAGSVGHSGGAVTAELEFDVEEAFEQGVRREAGFECNDGVDESRLVGEADGGRGIQGRPVKDAAESRQTRDRLAQRRGGWADGAGKVGAHPDVSRAHELQGISTGSCRGLSSDG